MKTLVGNLNIKNCDKKKKKKSKQVVATAHGTDLTLWERDGWP